MQSQIIYSGGGGGRGLFIGFCFSSGIKSPSHKFLFLSVIMFLINCAIVSCFAPFPLQHLNQHELLPAVALFPWLLGAM
jgi:hypothetical protein